MRWRSPTGLQQLEPEVAVSLARLTGLEGFARAVMVGVIPLAALETFGTKERVSYVFLAGAALTTLVTLHVGTLERLLHRRWVVDLGAIALFSAAILFMFADGPLFALAVGLRSAEASIFSVCMSLYIMDFIGKADFTRTESRRMVYQGAAWLVGPVLGITLWDSVAPEAPFLLSAVSTCCMLAFFWKLRLSNYPVISSPKSPAINPLAAIPQFFRQRRLRIAYFITLARAVFWATLFVYGPIYVVEAGLPTFAAGAFLSIASAMLFISPTVSRLAERHGVRRVIMTAYIVMGCSCVALASLGAPTPAGVVFWLTSAVGGATIDVLGNIPFMRLVKPRERAAMTGVFSTWREVSFLITPALAAVVLAVGPFWVLYLVVAILMFCAAALTSYLPKRL